MALENDFKNVMHDVEHGAEDVKDAAENLGDTVHQDTERLFGQAKTDAETEAGDVEHGEWSAAETGAVSDAHSLEGEVATDEAGVNADVKADEPVIDADMKQTETDVNKTVADAEADVPFGEKKAQADAERYKDVDAVDPTNPEREVVAVQTRESEDRQPEGPEEGSVHEMELTYQELLREESDLKRQIYLERYRFSMGQYGAEKAGDLHDLEVKRDEVEEKLHAAEAEFNASHPGARQDVQGARPASSLNDRNP